MQSNNLGCRFSAAAAGAVVCVLLTSCTKTPADRAQRGESPEVAAMGSLEITARLVEVPEGAVFKRELYNYATIL